MSSPLSGCVLFLCCRSSLVLSQSMGPLQHTQFCLLAYAVFSKFVRHARACVCCVRAYVCMCVRSTFSSENVNVCTYVSEYMCRCVSIGVGVYVCGM